MLAHSTVNYRSIFISRISKPINQYDEKIKYKLLYFYKFYLLYTLLWFVVRWNIIMHNVQLFELNYFSTTGMICFLFLFIYIKYIAALNEDFSLPRSKFHPSDKIKLSQINTWIFFLVVWNRIFMVWWQRVYDDMLMIYALIFCSWFCYTGKWKGRVQSQCNVVTHICTYVYK